MKFINQMVTTILATLIFISCKKQDAQPYNQQPDKTQFDYNSVRVPNNFFEELPVPGADDLNATPSANLTETGNTPDLNNGDDPIILGQQVPNPYTIANMQQAYLQLYGSTAPVPVTHLYIRYKPANTEQLSTLLDQPGLELQDYPMDYKVLQDGDYYQDPTLGTEDIGWQYSAVPVNYTQVPGIQYEVIEQLHIPANDDLLLEGMAESLAGGAIYDDTVIIAYRHITRIDEPSGTLIVPNRLPVPCEIDPCGFGCDPAGCGSGGGGGSTYNPQIPRGTIEVQDIRTCNAPATVSNVPVRQARVVCKRWFKIWTGYTTDQGTFLATRKFKNKVKVIVKTVNNHARVSKVRGIRVWQILFPVKKRIGVFDQMYMANITYLFARPNPTGANDKELPYWVATTTHNSLLEYKQYATEFGIGQPPAYLKVLITNWEGDRASGATPMFSKCQTAGSQDLQALTSLVSLFVVQAPIVGSVAILATLVNIIIHEKDVVIGYNALNADYNCRLTSANLKSIAFHQFGLTSLYKKLQDSQSNCEYWYDYRGSIAHETHLGNPNTRPFGDGTEIDAGKVAVVEMWGSYCEYLFTDRHYGNGGASGAFGIGFTARMQSSDWPNLSGGLNAYLNALENHNPNLVNDVHKWIPRGLCYDLTDPAGELFPVIDNVSGFTPQQCFNALEADVWNISLYKNKLLLQNGNSQQNQINTLFNGYNY